MTYASEIKTIQVLIMDYPIKSYTSYRLSHLCTITFNIWCVYSVNLCNIIRYYNGAIEGGDECQILKHDSQKGKDHFSFPIKCLHSFYI